MEPRWSKLAVLATAAALCLSRAEATWSTLYTFDKTKAFVQLDDNSLWSFPGNLTEIDASNASNQFTSLAAPPDRATLTVNANNQLLAVHGDAGCQGSPIYVSAYHPAEDQWDKIATSESNWFVENSTVWVQEDGMMYIYGGSCSGYSQVFNTLISFNTTSHEFEEVKDANSPASLASAGVVRIAANTFLMIGGRSTSGWISMNQVAVWEYGSWTYKSALNSSGIDSRTAPLLLPIWDVSDNETATSVLVIGGSVDGRQSDPYLGTLQLNSTSGWTWSAPSSAVTNVRGALTLFNTLISITQSGSSSSGLSVSMYSGSDYENTIDSYDAPTPVASTAASGATVTVTPSSAADQSIDNGSSSTLSTGGTIALSTVLPIAAAAAGVVAGIFLLRRRKQRNSAKNLHLSPSMSITGLFPPPAAPRYDSWYSGETASIHSWNEKRAQYEQNLHHETSHTSGVAVPSSPAHQQAPLPVNPFEEEDAESIFAGRDVQVLVSSVRRSQLRVTNPDIPTDGNSEYSAHSRQSSTTGVATPTEIHVHKRARSDLGGLGENTRGRTASELTRRITSISNHL